MTGKVSLQLERLNQVVGFEGVATGSRAGIQTFNSGLDRFQQNPYAVVVTSIRRTSHSRSSGLYLIWRIISYYVLHISSDILKSSAISEEWISDISPN